MIWFSKQACGFYDLAIHGTDIPTDAVEITTDEHMALLQGLSTGKIISADASGHPILIDPPASTTEQLAAVVRADRDQRIAETDYLVMPDYPIAVAKLVLVKTYRQALRDISLQSGFPSKITWPDSLA